MAINKNFVIKNGLEVNTNVLVAAADEKQVGIGTTRPYYKLHVGGGEGSRGGIGATDLTISGIATIGVAHSDSGAFSVLGISTFQGDIDLIGSAGVSTVRWDASKDGLIFQDNATARFGTGEDLRIWHDGSNSYISDQGTGSLIIYGTDETLAVFTDDGSVQLYNNDSKKLETTGLGITVYGDSIVSGVTTTARLNVTGVSTFTSVGSNLIPDTDGSRSIGAATSEWQDLFIDGTAKIDTLTVDESATVAVDVTVGTGVTLQRHGGVSIAGITTVGGVSTFNDDVTLVAAGSSTILFDASAHKIVLQDNIKAKFGTGEDLAIWHNGSNSFIENSTGNISVHSNEIVFRNGNSNKVFITFAADGVNIFDNNIERLSTTAIGATVFGDFIASGVGTFGKLYVTGISTFANTVNVSTGATITTAGNAAFAGIVTANGGVNVGTAVTIDAETGNVAVSGIMTVGGNLYVTGDITYDEVTGRNLNITGITTLADQVNFGTSGAAATVAQNGNATFSGIVTASQFQGGGIGVGIGSTTAHVGYGFTYLDLKGPGVSTVYASATTGITTIYFQGGGGSSVGAAGTWQNDGAPGISTAKSVGINTNSINDGDLQGRPYVGAAGSFQGLYIGNGMVVNDNQLNGDHYIGTAFGGMMAGPVTVNGVLTVDGNYVVV